MAALPKDRIVAIVGTGAMGAGIAQIAAGAGHPVLLHDVRAGAAAQAVASIGATFARLAEKGKLSAAEARAATARLGVADDLAALAPAALVVEAAVEDAGIKRDLFRDLEAVVADDAILATNTSSISITAIAAVLARPGRCAGLHFFNPAPVMPLVEVVSGMATDPAIAVTLFDTAAGWGKVPVQAASTPGFIVNRVARPFYAEGLRLLEEGVADTVAIDALVRDAGGFRMGPFELMDMIGHDVNFAVTRSVWSAFFNDPRFTPSLTQQELVAAGFLGRKSGRGFYDYAGGAAPPRPVDPPAPAVPAAIVIHGDTALATALASRLDARRVAFTHAPAHGDGRVATADGTALRLTDGRTAGQVWAADGRPVAVLDLALDYAQATRLAVAVPGRAVAAGLHAAGLLAAAGIVPVMVADSPALVVMRVVAMLANEAADAVHRGVAEAGAVDVAMRLGTNYPLGPLAWADAVGVGGIAGVLDNLAAFYGEDRYRLSPYLRARAIDGRACHD